MRGWSFGGNRLGPPRFEARPQTSIQRPPFVTHQGGTEANFGRQTPRPSAEFGRHGPLHDDRDGPAGPPSADAASGESQGREVRRYGGGQARRDGGPGPSRDRL